MPEDNTTEEDTGLFTLEQAIQGGRDIADRLGAAELISRAAGLGAGAVACLAEHFGNDTIVDQAFKIDADDTLS